jgi:predicted nuclease of restriction endonuclease-like RecB superfamily
MQTQRTDYVCGDQPLQPLVSRERRLETLEARIQHLEASLEALQDAVYRQAVLEEKKIGEVRRQLAPEQMARELSRDARRRGL